MVPATVFPWATRLVPELEVLLTLMAPATAGTMELGSVAEWAHLKETPTEADLARAMGRLVVDFRAVGVLERTVETDRLFRATVGWAPFGEARANDTHGGTGARRPSSRRHNDELTLSLRRRILQLNRFDAALHGLANTLLDARLDNVRASKQDSFSSAPRARREKA